MVYLGDAFSAGMLPAEDMTVKFSRATSDVVRRMLDEHPWVSHIANADTAQLLTIELKRQVIANRVGLELCEHDVLIVAQYNGPRLPDGATIRWIVARLLTRAQVRVEGGAISFGEPNGEGGDVWI